MSLINTTASANGRRVAYTDTGGTGPAVLLAHGFALDKSMFAAAAAALAPTWRVIAWDSRGHGDTADDRAPFTFYDLARDQLALMDALGIDRAIVGGISQGGFTALRTALLASDRISALLLCDTEAAALDPVDAAAYAQMFSALAQRGPVDELVVPLAAQIIGEHPAAGDWVARWRQRGVPLGAPVDCLTGRDDITDRLAGIRCPVLLLRGEHDQSIPLPRMRVLAEKLPHTTGIQVVAGAGHSPTVTHPEASAALLRRFLTGELPVS
jgi:pimeloyl-ACP methyl ester carboxylesterase